MYTFLNVTVYNFKYDSLIETGQDLENIPKIDSVVKHLRKISKARQSWILEQMSRGSLNL